MTAEAQIEKARGTWERMKGLPPEVLGKLAFAVELLLLAEKYSQGGESKSA